MIGSIQANTTAVLNYGKEMADVSGRISKAFQEDADVKVATELAKSTIIEHGHRASHKLMKVQDEMVGSVLDILA